MSSAADRPAPDHDELTKRMESMKLDASIQTIVLHLCDFEHETDKPSDVIAGLLGSNGREIMTAIVMAGVMSRSTWNLSATSWALGKKDLAKRL